MSSLILTFILMTNPLATVDPIVDIAVENCKNVTPDRVEEAKKIARKLFYIEQMFKVPPELKGMVLAAACSESGFNPIAKGDRKFSRNKKTPKAIGILQLWPWWEHKRWGYGIDRRDPEASAYAWMSHIKRQLRSVKKRCKPKASGRCRERPKHLRNLRKFHRAYNKLR